MPGHFGRVYLDTNIFILLRESLSEVSSDLLEMVSRVPIEPVPLFVTCELTLAELLPKPLAEGNGDLVETYDHWMTSSDWLFVAPVTREIFSLTGWIRSRFGHLKTPDAIHLAAAATAQCTHFLTDDRGFRAHYDLPTSHLGQMPAQRSIAVLRPDPETISTVIASYAP